MRRLHTSMHPAAVCRRQTLCLRGFESFSRPAHQRSFNSSRQQEIHPSPPPTTKSSSIHPISLDYPKFFKDPVHVCENASKRKVPFTQTEMRHMKYLSDKRRAIITDLSSGRYRRGQLSDMLTKERDPKIKADALVEAKALKETLADLKEKLVGVEASLLEIALKIPNDTHPNAPVGAENAAVVLTTSGPPPKPYSSRRDHVAIAERLELVNFPAAATVTGSSWYYLLNEAALLENALIQYAMKLALRRGFTPVMTPDVIKSDIAQRCGFQPRDKDSRVQHMYHLEKAHDSSQELVLSGTAEIPLAGLSAMKEFNKPSLPLKLVGLGKAFRSEAGARGAETRGLFRVHQFTKLELFVVCVEGESESVMKEMVDLQLEIFEGLGLSIRALDMPTEELGASAYRKIDIEAWMPGRGNWGEISSSSNCTDYQSRRLNIRYKTESSDSEDPKPIKSFAHTLNGTAMAVPRIIVALIENGARIEEGKVVGLDLPRVLQPFWLEGFNGKANIRWI